MHPHQEAILAGDAVAPGHLRQRLRGLDELDGLLDRFLAYGQTTTSIVRSSPVAPRSLPLPTGPRANGFTRKPRVHRRVDFQGTMR